LALAAILGTLAAVSVSDVDAAVVAFSVIPVAAIVCGLSFVRSVIIEQRGNPRAQALRVAAVVGFSVVALAASM
jgi:molybdopterin biosynthesis enzyme